MDGWTAEAYAIVIPATQAEQREIEDFSAGDPPAAEQTKFQNEFVKKHLLSGKVFYWDDDNNLVLDDLQPDDLDDSGDLATKLFLEINGLSLDPKDLRALQAKLAIESPTSKPSTAAKRSKKQ